MSLWWNTISMPIIGFMRHAHYPEDSVQSYTSFLRDEILPLLGPYKRPPYPSWMTDDRTPVEFSLVLGGETKSASVRFAIEPSILPLTGNRSISTLRDILQRRSLRLPSEPQFDLEWFDICAKELLLAETEDRPRRMDHPGSEVFLGFDCAHHSITMKVYFMPRIRCLVTNESPGDIMERLAHRMSPHILRDFVG